MNIYKIWQKYNTDWDTYDSAIVTAETEEEARRITPGSDVDEWVSDFNYVNVKLIGKAVDGTKSRVILGSFNAG
jgi:hypothetical protein